MEGSALFSDRRMSLEEALRTGHFPPLETFPCPYAADNGSTGVIRIVFPEFTCVCPKTGYPDFGAITLLYLPGAMCLELKSWKIYCGSFRMIGAFHEAVSAHLFTTLRDLLAPRWAMVIADFFPRGNVDTTIVFETGGVRPAGVDALLGVVPPRCAGFGDKGHPHP